MYIKRKKYLTLSVIQLSAKLKERFRTWNWSIFVCDFIYKPVNASQIRILCTKNNNNKKVATFFHFIYKEMRPSPSLALVIIFFFFFLRSNPPVFMLERKNNGLHIELVAMNDVALYNVYYALWLLLSFYSCDAEQKTKKCMRK